MGTNCIQESEKRHPDRLSLFRIGLDCYTGECALGHHYHMSLGMRYRKSSYPTGRQYPLWRQTKYIKSYRLFFFILLHCFINIFLLIFTFNYICTFKTSKRVAILFINNCKLKKMRIGRRNFFSKEVSPHTKYKV